jgi:hypothetical protein
MVFLFSAADLRELFKGGVLIDHFYETKKTDSSVSFVGFLVMHYITDDANSNDDDRDMQLPFKSPYSFTANAVNTFIPGYQLAEFKALPLNSIVTVPPVHSKETVGHNTSVWRPPQA